MTTIIQGHPSVLADRGDELAPLSFTVCADCGEYLGRALWHVGDRWKCSGCAGKLTGHVQPQLPELVPLASAVPTGFDFDADAIREHLGSDLAALAVLEALHAGEITGPRAMAEIVPDEGLNLKLGIFPKNGTNLGTVYLGLFTAFTAATVGTSAQGMASYTEADFGSYLVQSVAAADWGSVAAGTGGRRVTAAQKSFPAATTVGSAINGYTLRNQSTFSGATCLGAANFDEGQVPALAIGDIVRVTATWQENN